MCALTKENAKLMEKQMMTGSLSLKTNEICVESKENKQN